MRTAHTGDALTMPICIESHCNICNNVTGNLLKNLLFVNAGEGISLLPLPGGSSMVATSKLSFFLLLLLWLLDRRVSKEMISSLKGKHSDEMVFWPDLYSGRLLFIWLIRTTGLYNYKNQASITVNMCFPINIKWRNRRDWWNPIYTVGSLNAKFLMVVFDVSSAIFTFFCLQAAMPCSTSGCPYNQCYSRYTNV